VPGIATRPKALTARTNSDAMVFMLFISIPALAQALPKLPALGQDHLLEGDAFHAFVVAHEGNSA
jgi:hypothetical protein